MPHAIEADLDAIAGCRVFFGHQSVGENILAGLRAHVRKAGRDLSMYEYRGQFPAPNVSTGSSPVLLHARVGRNEQPLTKCEAFQHILDDELAGQVDVALLKFCYIDINERTDTDALFEQYRKTLDDLARRHPAVAFVPVTAPLRHTPRGLGVLARELLGRPNRSKRDNLARHRFNERLREAYASTPIFDLAAVQATRPDGRRETFRQHGRTGEALVQAYTDDGGHLNAAGQAVAAAAMLRALADAVQRRT